MKITFLGAAHEVTGSCTYIEVGDKKGIVDYGMEQGQNLFENCEIPVSPAELDFALLTHAHIDHSGNLPLLYKRGFRGSVYCTAATVKLSHIMLRDSAHIQMTEAEYQNRKSERSGGPKIEPLYDLDDAEGVLALFIPCDYGRLIQINDCVSVRFTDVGHLLGSSAIEVFLREGEEKRSICFSGDLGNTNQPILNDPKGVKNADYLVIESTYGNREHDEVRADYVTELASRIQKVLDRGGNLVIPSFAVGRTQEMLYFIREIKERGLVRGHGEFPVYLDSPLAIEATAIFLQCDTQFLDEDMRAIIRSGRNPLVFPGLEPAVGQDESKAINNDKTPKIIISASGMCDAGRIRHHLKHNLWRRESMVLFVGYQSNGTLGRILVDGAEKVKLFGDEIQVNASIEVLPGISGHAGRSGLRDWLSLFEVRPSMVFVNHGDPDSADAFTAELNTDGYKAFAPYSGTVFNLISGEFELITDGVPIEKKAKARSVSESYTRLVASAEELLSLCKKIEGRANKLLNSYYNDICKLINKINE